MASENNTTNRILQIIDDVRCSYYNVFMGIQLYNAAVEIYFICLKAKPNTIEQLEALLTEFTPPPGSYNSFGYEASKITVIKEIRNRLAAV